MNGARPARLRGRVALITGAGSPLGAAIAHAFAAEGAQLVLADADEARAAALADAIGPAARAVRLDVHEELGWVCALARTLDAHGRFDVLVHDAGTGSGDAAVLGCRQTLRAMLRGPRRSEGAIVLVAEPAFRAAAHGPLVLHAGQAALGEHVRALAWQCTRQRLRARCHLVQPVVATRRRPAPASLRGVVAAALWLASDEGHALNGAEVQVGAGRLPMPPARVGSSR